MPARAAGRAAGSRRGGRALLVLLLPALLLAGCAPASDGGSMIAFLPQRTGDPYAEAVAAGARAGLADAEGRFKTVGPTRASADAQASYLATLTQQGVGAILLTPNDSSALTGALGEARLAGIAVVTVESDTDPGLRDLHIAPATPVELGGAPVELIAERIGDQGSIAILAGTPNDPVQGAWAAAIRTAVEREHPGIEVVDQVYGEDDDEVSFHKTEALLAAHPGLDGIISTSRVGLPAAARALAAASPGEPVALTGFGLPSSMREAVAQGVVTSFVLWDPQDLGRLAAQAARELLEGRLRGEVGERFTVAGLRGGAREFTVGADGVVVLGAPIVIDGARLDDYDF